MRAFLIAITLVGCNGDNPSAIDAAPIDAVPDAPPVLDCPTYCAEIQVNCTDTNAQYADRAACDAACKSFTVGTSTVTDMSGNTLGCRIYHAGPPSQTAPTTHCAHAGPGGDLITATSPGFCSGGDICTSFCALEIAACGSLDAPLPGNPRDSTNNPLFQYQNMANCVEACSKFDKTHPYSTTASGNSLACRLNEAVRASISVMPDGAMHCSATAANLKGACAGTAMP